MPSEPNTPNFRMANRCVGGDLAGLLVKMHDDEGLSLRRIERQLFVDHGIEVTYATLATWLKTIKAPVAS
jgi:hypothetical protein